MSTVLYLLLAAASALAFHLSTVHQHLCPRAAAHRGLLRACGWAGAVASLAAAITALGTWAGVFAVLTAWMLAAVLLPYLDAWRVARGNA